MIHFDATTAAAAESTTVSLLGGFAQDLDVIYAQGGFKFNLDGTTLRQQGGASVLINSATDWIFPRTSFTAGDFQVRGTYDSIIADLSSTQPFNVIPKPVGTAGSWVNLNSTQQYIWVCSTTTFGPIKRIHADIRFEIRNQNDSSFNTETSVVDATAIADDGIYTINIEAFTLN